MLSSNSENGWQFSLICAVLAIAAIGFVFYRNRVRRSSLHRREDGVYVWVEWHGGERTSLQDPSETGGAWDSDGDGDGGGDGGD